MNMKEFCESIKRELEVSIGDGVTVSVNKVSKNNGVVLNGVVILKKDRNISPTIYLDEFFEEYKKGKMLGEVIKDLTQIYRNSVFKENLDMDFFINYDKLKEKVAFKMVGLEKNDWLLKDIPHIVFLNMAIVFYCCVPEEDLGKATILIYNNHLQMWGISKEKLLEDALANTKKMLPPKLLSMEKMMEEIFAEDLKKEFLQENSEFLPDEDWFDKAARQMLSSVTDDPNCGSMFVLGNEYKMFGAAAILYEGVLKAFADKLEKNVFILPSSIHEVILIPDDGEQEAKDLWKMVCDINATQVAPEEVLTDSVYYFTRNTNKINQIY